MNTFFEKRLCQLVDLAELVEKVFASAGLEYRVIGGLAAYLDVEEVEPDAGRLTKDIDIAVRQADLDRTKQAAEIFGLQSRRVSDVEMLVQRGAPSTRRGVHLEPTPELGSSRTIKGIRLASLNDLVRMKLTSFRAQDKAHLKDLDEAGLITPDIEAGLSPALRERLAQVRIRE